MRVLIQVLVGLSVLLPLGVVISLGNPRRSESPTIAWLLAAWGWVTVAFESLLFAAVLGIQLPSWIGAVVLGAQNAVFAWWLVAVHRARHAAAASTDHPTPDQHEGQPMAQPTPTQTRHPWRATARTLIAGALGLASLLPYILAGTHLEGTALGVQALAVAGAITRILAIPGVNDWLSTYLPWLAASPRKDDTPQ